MSMMKMIPFMVVIMFMSSVTMFEKSSTSLKFCLMKETDLNLSFMKSEISMMFSIMISVVTLIIMYYSTFYMEFYNKKKFNVLTMTFFMSMAILSFSEDFTSTMMGWDGLGISSICLIMMYQSKSTMMNSLTTMAFNRMGDVLIMTGIMMSAINISTLSFLVCKEMNKTSMLILLMASMTKSAQFPLSTWLPAAMSAPTPISAMVHSSTLVTAGVYLVMKLYEPLMNNNMLKYLTTVSSLSMLTAGFCTIYAMDLKKVVAFSTMSHISMMMFMISKGMMKMSAIHMLSHAMFKTSIFMSAGVLFMSSMSNQTTMSLSKMKMSNEPQDMLMKTSVISLTGVPFSSSFYSKDLFMENLLMMSNKMSSTLIIMCSTIMTMMYSLKMMKNISEKMNFSKNFSIKKNSLISSVSLSMISTSGSSLSLIISPTKMVPMVEKMEMILMPTSMMISIFFSKMKSKVTMIMSTSMMMKKILTTKEVNNMIKFTMIMNMSDAVMTNKNTWKFNFLMNFKNQNSFYLNSLILIILTSSFMFIMY